MISLPLRRGDSLHRCLRRGDGRNGGNSRQHRRTPNRLLVEERVLPARRIDDELNAIALDQVDDVGPALPSP